MEYDMSDDNNNQNNNNQQKQKGQGGGGQPAQGISLGAKFDAGASAPLGDIVKTGAANAVGFLAATIAGTLFLKGVNLVIEKYTGLKQPQIFSGRMPGQPQQQQQALPQGGQQIHPQAIASSLIAALKQDPSQQEKVFARLTRELPSSVAEIITQQVEEVVVPAAPAPVEVPPAPKPVPAPKPAPKKEVDKSTPVNS